MDNNDNLAHEEHSLTDLIAVQKKWLSGQTISIAILGIAMIYLIVSWYGDRNNLSSRIIYGTAVCIISVFLLADMICLILGNSMIRKNREIMNSGLYRTNERAEKNFGQKWRSFERRADFVTGCLRKAMVFIVFPAAGLLTFQLLYGTTAQSPATQMQETDETESTSYSFEEEDKYIDFLLTSDPDRLYEKVPAYQSAEEWMKNRTIEPQVLYEDDRFKLELTGYSFRDGNLLVETVFTNNSEKTVTAGAIAGSVYLNDMGAGPYVSNSYGMKTDDGVLPGAAKEAVFILPENALPTYDPWLEKLEFMLEVWEGTGNFSNPKTLLLTTDPIIIHTQAEGRQDPAKEDTEEFKLIMEPGMKVLYESDELRVIGRGIMGQLYDDNTGEYVMPAPDNYYTRTTWEFLVENHTDHEIVIDHLECSINGEKALSAVLDEDWLEIPDPEHNVLNEYYEVEFNRIPKVIDAGRRREFHYSLERPENIEGEESSGENERVDWLLGDIETASAQFVVNYTDSAGETQQVQIADEYIRPDR